jgi:linoleoyl-CoA desaturase
LFPLNFFPVNRRIVKFSRANDTDFVSVLRSRVKAHFEAEGRTKHGDTSMFVKTAFMISLYFIPYLLMMTGVVTNTWAIMSMWAIMGFGAAGIGLSIMHDANHGAYSANKNVNKYLGRLLNVVGGSAFTWKIQHNVLHHSYTNIDGMDEDIAPVKVLRFSPHQERYGWHRFQHFYAWFFYGLMTIAWITVKDFKGLYHYRSLGLVKDDPKAFRQRIASTVLTKVVYYAYALVLPLILLPTAWWQTVLFFLLMHFITGLTLGMIFQPAHVMPETEFPLPDDEGQMENNWAIHQLLTTTNFAPKAKLFSWYVGGLNYQIEHHLFPNICHIHYQKLSKIVKQTAEEYGLPYHVQPTFYEAVRKHAVMLRDLGRVDPVPVSAKDKVMA